MSITARSKKQNVFLILILGALNTITPFSIDMYLPAFPQIAADLHTSIRNVSLSVSTYFLGFSLGQILYGPLLDRFGRKPPLYTGLCLYIIATFLCITSGSIEALWVIRFIQALSGCVASVAAMAMVRDFFPVDKSASVISVMVLILGASPLLAPTAGSFVADAWGWHAVFIFLVAIAFIILVCVFFFLPEGHKADNSISLKPQPIINGFKDILFEPKFYVFALAGSFSFSGLFVYVANSPAIFMDFFHLSAKAYGGIFALLSVGFISGSQLNHLFTRKFSNEGILQTAIILQVIVAGLFLAGSFYTWFGMTAVIIALFIFLSCAGLTYPNAAALALKPFSKNAGTASALLGFFQIGLGALISASMTIIHFKVTIAMALIMWLSAAVGLGILMMGKRALHKSGVK